MRRWSQLVEHISGGTLGSTLFNREQAFSEMKEVFAQYTVGQSSHSCTRLPIAVLSGCPGVGKVHRRRASVGELLVFSSSSSSSSS